MLTARLCNSALDDIKIQFKTSNGAAIEVVSPTTTTGMRLLTKCIKNHLIPASNSV